MTGCLQNWLAGLQNWLAQMTGCLHNWLAQTAGWATELADPNDWSVLTIGYDWLESGNIVIFGQRRCISAKMRYTTNLSEGWTSSTALGLLLNNYLPQDYHIKIIRRGSRMAVISTARCIAASGEQIVLYKINVYI